MTDEGAPEPGKCVVLQAGIRRILAPNPSMMTKDGTNTYIFGTGEVAIIDPGPPIGAHLDAILAGLAQGERVSHIFVTHAHLDHSGLAPKLARATGAAVHAFGTALSGRSAVMTRLASQTTTNGGEGLDHGFVPDHCLVHGAVIAADSWALEAIHTPGHLGGHVSFASDAVLFSGDHVMGWSTSLISPPDGDMTDYLASLAILARRRWDTMLPAHGDPVTNPAQRIADLIAHRQDREAAIMAAMRAGAQNIAALTSAVYRDLAPTLVPAARRNMLAHLIDLEQRNLVQATPFAGENATFTPR